MHFEKDHLYHIYNQGNNKQKIFFNEENYLFFLRKVKTCFNPFADIIAWCLMPNHFHFMVYTRGISGSPTQSTCLSGSPTLSRATTKEPASLNQSIGILLASYTRAINKQEGRTGSLFRAKTKASCITGNDELTPAYFDTMFGAVMNYKPEEKEYPQLCFKYIHDNPVKAGLVSSPVDWAYSSARDYSGLRNGTLINKERAKDFILF